MTAKPDEPILEITLRRYEKPNNLSRRDRIRRLLLSLGLLQPGDSRDIIVDIFLVLLNARDSEELLSSKEIEKRAVQNRKENGLALVGVASSNIRRQVKRLRDILLVEKVRARYRIAEFSRIDDIITEKIEKYYVPLILARIKDYAKAVQE
jgi:hypothetical protein